MAAKRPDRPTVPGIYAYDLLTGAYHKIARPTVRIIDHDGFEWDVHLDDADTSGFVVRATHHDKHHETVVVPRMSNVVHIEGVDR